MCRTDTVCSLCGASHSVNSGSCFSTSTTRSRTRCMDQQISFSSCADCEIPQSPCKFLSSVWQSKSTWNPSPPPPSPPGLVGYRFVHQKKRRKKKKAPTNLHNWSLYFTSSLLATVLGSRKDPRPLIIPTTMPFSDGFKRWPQNTHTRA